MKKGRQEEMFLAIARALGIWKMKIFYFFVLRRLMGESARRIIR
jgi:hypothetical protein